MDVMVWAGIRRANGLAFSCRERAGRSPQNANDLAREAVNCNAVFGGSRDAHDELFSEADYAA
jgi:hypothetical protein